MDRQRQSQGCMGPRLRQNRSRCHIWPHCVSVVPFQKIAIDVSLSFQSPTEVAATAVPEAARVAHVPRLAKVRLLHHRIGLAVDRVGLSRPDHRTALNRLPVAVAVAIDLGLGGRDANGCCCGGSSQGGCGELTEVHGVSGYCHWSYAT